MVNQFCHQSQRGFLPPGGCGAGGQGHERVPR